MLAVELDALHAVVLVDLKTIGQAHPRAAANGAGLRAAANVAKGNRIDRLAARRGAHLELQVLLADDAGIQDIEFPVEHRLGKSLAPGTCGAQGKRRADRELPSLKLAIREHPALQLVDIGSFGNLRGKGAAKPWQILAREREARRHCVAAKLDQQSGMAGR